jgi:hypothetical protein
MNIIDKIYAPYNFTTSPFIVIPISVEAKGYLKIEYKIPNFLQKLKGIYVSVTVGLTPSKIAGLISLNFNSQSLKAFQRAVPKTYLINDCSKPYELNETIDANSLMQGYYFDTSQSSKYPYLLSIYLHYEPIEEVKPKK